MKLFRNIIYSWKIWWIYRIFKAEIASFTHNLNINYNYKLNVFDAMEESGGNTEVWFPHFYSAIGYFRGSFDNIVNQAAWRLKQDLDYYNTPAIKPKYQQLFRNYLITHLNGLLHDAVILVEPLMKEIKLDKEALEHVRDVQKDFNKLLFPHIHQVDGIFSKLFTDYNNNIKQFKDSKKANIALVISIIAIIVTIWVNFRNEIWNYIFHH